MATDLAKRIDTLIGEERTYMAYEGDICWFWESVRDHGWGAVREECVRLLDDIEAVLDDCRKLLRGE